MSKKHHHNNESRGILETFVAWGLIGITFLIPLLYSNNRIAATVTFKQYFFIGAVDLILIGLVWLWIHKPIYRLTKQQWLLFIPIGIYMISYTISTFFSADIPTAVYSSIERGGGWIFMMHIAGFVVAMLSVASVQGKEFLKWIGRSVIGSGLIVTFLTLFTSESFNIGVQWLNDSIGGATLGNSTHAGAFLIFVLTTIIIAAYYTTSRARKIWYGISIVFILLSTTFFNVKEFFVDGTGWGKLFTSPTIILGEARAATLSIILGIVVTAVMYYFFTVQKIWIKRSIAIFLGVFFLGIIFIGAQVLQNGSKIQSIFNETVGPNRVIFWEESLKGFAERPIIGWGPENFKTIHQKFVNPILLTTTHAKELWVNKPHNQLIETLSNQGVIGLGAYLGVLILLTVLLIRATRQKIISPFVGSVALGGLFAYVLQNQFAFDSVTTYVYFWGMVGLILGIQKREETHSSIHDTVPKDILPIIGGIITVGLIVVWIFSAYFPSRKTIEAKKIFEMPVVKRIDQYEKLFSGAGSRQLVTGISVALYGLAESYIRDRDMVRSNPQFVAIANKELEALLNLGKREEDFLRNDYRFFLSMAIFQESELALSPSYSKDKIEYANHLITRATDLGPTNPLGYFVYSKILLYSEEYEKSRVMINKAIDLNPYIPEFHMQSIRFEQVFGNRQQQRTAIEKLQQYLPDYHFEQ